VGVALADLHKKMPALSNYADALVADEVWVDLLRG